MARFVSDSLPEDALALLRPGNLDEKRNRVVQIITVDEEGWANAGMLSYADVIAKDGGSLNLATWGDGECAADLRRNGRITLLVIDDDMAYYVKGRASEIQVSGGCAHGRKRHRRPFRPGLFPRRRSGGIRGSDPHGQGAGRRHLRGH